MVDAIGTQGESANIEPKHKSDGRRVEKLTFHKLFSNIEINSVRKNDIVSYMPIY